MDKFSEIKKRLIDYAEKDEEIKAIIAIGSSTRKEVKADEYSDLDLLIVTDTPDKWNSGEYPKLLGNVNISFAEPTMGGAMERRCMYDDDKDVDFIAFTSEQFEYALEAGIAGFVMNRGYSILYGAEAYQEKIGKFIFEGKSNPQMSEEEFLNIVNDFYFHNIWSLKKLLRGELWAGKMCTDAYLKNYLLRIMEIYCHDIEGKDVWHDGRFIDTWANDSIKEELSKCFAHYERADVYKAVKATNQLFTKLSEEIAEKKGYRFPEEAKDCAKRYIDKCALLLN